MSDLQEKVEILKNNVREYPDFPKKGVLFRDIFSVLQKPELLATLREVLVAYALKVEPRIECVVAIDARGFLLGPIIALELNVPFVPVRKKGKLPGDVESENYTLEYGEGTVQIQQGSIKKDQVVLIVDDLLATGGSMRAACKLVEKLQGKVAACLVLMEITKLEGRSIIPQNVISILKY